MSRFPLALVLCAVLPIACVHHRQQAADPSQAPPVAAAPTVALPPAPPPCDALGLWSFQGANGGGDQVQIQKGDTPDSYVIHHNNVTAIPGAQGSSRQDIKVDLRATGGLSSCQMAADCSAMQCNIAGAPITLKKLGT